MRRILAVAFTAALVLLALQAPTAAKGPDSATITGPGIGTKKLTPVDSSLASLLEVTRFWDGADNALWAVKPPAGELGPRFEVTYRVPGPDVSRIRQDLYPFAADGPVVHMAEGQTMYGMGMPHGWLPTDDRLTRIVERLGGTAPPVASRIAPAAHEESTSGRGPGWGALALGAAGAVVLAAGGQRLRSRRRA